MRIQARTTREQPGAPVAILDTGVDATASDLVGQVDSADGADCSTGTCTVWSGPSADPEGDGTSVAGIVGAAADNGIGIAGIAFNSPIIPIRVATGFDAPDVATFDGPPDPPVDAGVAWAVQHGARVILIPFVGADPNVCAAIATATNDGAVVVAAAGQEAGATSGNNVRYPAACAGVVGVAGIGVTSNGGWPDVFTAAESAAWTITAGGYGNVNDTGAAAAYVAGVAALMLGDDPARTPADIRNIISRSGSKIGPGWNQTDPSGDCGSNSFGCSYNVATGYGVLRADEAVAGPAPALGPSGGVLTPAGGNGGTLVTVHGIGLSGTTGVTINGQAQTGVAVLDDSDVQFTISSTATDGSLCVVVQRTHRTSAGTPCTGIQANDWPDITAVTPTAHVGDTLTISGDRLSDVNGVFFSTGSGQVSATPTVVSDTTVHVTVPTQAVTGTLTVFRATGKSATSPSVAIEPTITSLSSEHVNTGQQVAVHGTAFYGVDGVSATPTVTLGGQSMSCVGGTDHTIVTCTVPADAAGGTVAVTTNGGSVTSTDRMEVMPTLSGFSPQSGSPGTVVTIAGTGLEAVDGVAFHGAAASTITHVSGIQLKAVVPDDAATGTVAIANSRIPDTVTSSASFTVTPGISSFGPTPVKSGQTLAVHGTGLDVVQSATIAGVAAPVTATSATEVDVTVPDGAVTGALVLTTPLGPVTTSTQVVVVPRIDSFAPTTGRPGTTVTFSGGGFLGVRQVRFGGVAVAVAPASAHVLSAVVPADAVTGPVVLANGDGTSTQGGTFAVQPFISGLSTITGAAGTTVTISGGGLDDATDVRFNTADGSITSKTATTITVVVPPNALIGKVVVTTPSGSAVSTSLFLPVPTIASFTPASGAIGSPVTVNGACFGAIERIILGHAIVRTFTVVSPTEITLLIPPGAHAGTIQTALKISSR